MLTDLHIVIVHIIYCADLFQEAQQEVHHDTDLVLRLEMQTW